MRRSDFLGALAGEEELRITVERKGKKRTLPIWFVIEGSKVHLLPMYGLKTRWFVDLESGGGVQIRVKEKVKSVSPKVIRDPAAVDRVKRLFGQKYGVSDVKRYYPSSEVALEVAV